MQSNVEHEAPQPGRVEAARTIIATGLALAGIALSATASDAADEVTIPHYDPEHYCSEAASADGARSAWLYGTCIDMELRAINSQTDQHFKF